MTSSSHKVALAAAAVVAAAGAAAAATAAVGAISADGQKPAVQPGTVTAVDPSDGVPDRWGILPAAPEIPGTVRAVPPPEPNRWELMPADEGTLRALPPPNQSPNRWEKPPT